jgi:hypothetical protein
MDRFDEWLTVLLRLGAKTWLRRLDVIVNYTTETIAR